MFFRIDALSEQFSSFDGLLSGLREGKLWVSTIPLKRVFMLMVLVVNVLMVMCLRIVLMFVCGSC